MKDMAQMGPFFNSSSNIYSLTAHIVGFLFLLMVLWKNFSTEVSDL